VPELKVSEDGPEKIDRRRKPVLFDRVNYTIEQDTAGLFALTSIARLGFEPLAFRAKSIMRCKMRIFREIFAFWKDTVPEMAEDCASK
jgi:hypothetical protein